MARRKSCPKHLKIKIDKLKKVEQKLVELKKERREFLHAKHKLLTGQQIISTHRKMNCKIWERQRKIRSLKYIIGMSQARIIIPVKQHV